MKTFNEWKRGPSTKTITITCRDLDNNLEDLIEYIKEIGNDGHSFFIMVDPATRGGKRFDWDGDGSDAIFEINRSLIRNKMKSFNEWKEEINLPQVTQAEVTLEGNRLFIKTTEGKFSLVLTDQQMEELYQAGE